MLVIAKCTTNSPLKVFCNVLAGCQRIQLQCPSSTLDGSKFISLVSNPFTGEKQAVESRGLALNVITHDRTETSHKNPFRDCVYCCIFKVASLAQNVRHLKWLQFLFRAEVATKHTDITPHIPALVYCEVFTNVCFSRDDCIWRETWIHSRYKSHQSPRWALEKRQKEEQKKLQQVNNNNTTSCVRCFSNVMDPLWFICSGGHYLRCAAHLGSVSVCFYTRSSYLVKIQTRGFQIQNSHNV